MIHWYYPLCYPTSKFTSRKSNSVYTCQLFLMQRREIFIRICGIALLMSENAQNLPIIYKLDNLNISKDAPNIFGSPLPSTTSALLKIREYSVEELPFGPPYKSIIALSTNYHLDVHIFQTFVRNGFNNSYFPVRHEILVRRHDGV